MENLKFQSLAHNQFQEVITLLNPDLHFRKNNVIESLEQKVNDGLSFYPVNYHDISNPEFKSERIRIINSLS